MDFLSIEDICAIVDISLPTVNRRILWLKKNDRALYDKAVRTDGKKKVYSKTLVIPFLEDFKVHAKTAKQQGAKSRKDKGSAAAKKNSPSSTGKAKKESAAAKSRKEEPAPAAKKSAGPKKRPGDEARPGYYQPKGEQPAIHPYLLHEPDLLFHPDDEIQKAYRAITDKALKERFEITVAVCNDYATGVYTLGQACNKNGVSEASIYNWMNRYDLIQAVVIRAKKEFRKNLGLRMQEEAELNLYKLVAGQEYDEVQQTYIEVEEPDGSITRLPKGRRTTNKKILPNLGAIIFTLTNKMPKDWKNRQQFEATVSDEQKVKDEISRLTYEEKMALLEQAMRAKLLTDSGAVSFAEEGEHE